MLDNITTGVYFIVAVFMSGYGLIILLEYGVERDVFLFVVIGGMCLRVVVDKLLEKVTKSQLPSPLGEGLRSKSDESLS